MLQNNFSTRFRRQYGLVRQDAVENLKVLIVGDSEILPYLLLNLAFCGVGSLNGGVYLQLPEGSGVVSERHVKNQFLLRGEDIGTQTISACVNRLKELSPNFKLQMWTEQTEKNVVSDLTIFLPLPGEELTKMTVHSCRLFGQLSPAGVYIGHEQVEIEPFEANVFTPSLASLAGAILAQDVLRLTNSTRAIAIAEQEVQVSMRLRSANIARYFALSDSDRALTHHGVVARLKLGGEMLDVRAVVRGDRNDEGLFNITLPVDTFLSRVILSSIELVEDPLSKKGGIRDPLFISLLGGERLDGSRLVYTRSDYPVALEKLSALVLGVGGLGTWVTALLAVTPSDLCSLTMVDSDFAVEEHNLNRQVLYNTSHIGMPKIFAAADALHRIRSDINIHMYPMKLTEEIVRYVKHDLSLPYDAPAPALSEQADGVSEHSRRVAMLYGDMQQSDIILSCLDNMQSRWVLNVVAWMLDKTFINGGSGGFVGTADFIQRNAGDASLVYRYGEEIKHDSGQVQCGGTLPILSIVTTNAVIASLQSALAVAAAIKERPLENYFYFDGRGREFWKNTFREPAVEDSLGIAQLIEQLES